MTEILDNDELAALDALIEAERPEIDRRLQLMRQAATGDSFSAVLRRAIGSSRITLGTIANSASLTEFELSDFLCGSRELTSPQVDRIVVTLGLRPELISPELLS